MESLNIIGSVCSILSFLIALFVADQVMKIKKTINKSDHKSQNEVSVKSTKVGKDFTGRDKTSN